MAKPNRGVDIPLVPHIFSSLNHGVSKPLPVNALYSMSWAPKRAKGRIEVTYDGGPLGPFQVTLSAREGGFDVTFLRGARGRYLAGD